jgi:hypothetical protein
MTAVSGRRKNFFNVIKIHTQHDPIFPIRHIDWSTSGTPQGEIQRSSQPQRSHNINLLLQAYQSGSLEQNFFAMADQTVLSELCSIWCV